MAQPPHTDSLAPDPHCDYNTPQPNETTSQAVAKIADRTASQQCAIVAK